MNIQRLDPENQERSVDENVKESFIKNIFRKMNILENWRKTKMYILENWGKKKKCILEYWRKTVLLACVLALAIDPLFLFIPELNTLKKCFTFNKEVGIVVCVLRTFIDIFYQIHFIYPFLKKLIHPISQKSWRDVLQELSKALREKRILFYLIVDCVSILPIPQAVLLTVLESKKIPIRFIKWIIVGQYIPRIIRIYPLYKKVTRTSGTIAESNWIGAALNLFLFLMCSYVFGAFWYVNGVQKTSICWRAVCANTTGCIDTILYCQDVDNSVSLNNSCPLIEPEEIANLITNSPTYSTNVYDFGMYIEVLKSGVAEVTQRDFPRKFVYCFWWGLRNLSTFAQSLKPGNSATDIFFAIIICSSGLFMFALFIGNVQKHLISTTVRLEEKKEKQRDTERWMFSRNLSDDLKERIRKYDMYKWRKSRGTEEVAFLRSLPENLRLETKRHLYKDLINHVSSLFVSNDGLVATMNDWLLEALCDRVKSVYYSANICIVKEDDPVKEILIVTKGELECTTTFSDPYRLKEGDICGDLHVWIHNPTSSSHFPTSDRTIKTLTDVEGFILLPDDLKFVASHLDRVQ